MLRAHEPVQRRGKSTKAGCLSQGQKIGYEYDMGSTAALLITVEGTTWRKPQKEAVRLLARNVPPKFFCAECGAPAEYICTECALDTDGAYYCGACASGREHEDTLLPITNSPRMGVCGYAGELDIYPFDP